MVHLQPNAEWNSLVGTPMPVAWFVALKELSHLLHFLQVRKHAPLEEKQHLFMTGTLRKCTQTFSCHPGS